MVIIVFQWLIKLRIMFQYFLSLIIMCIVKFTLSKYNSQDDSDIVKTINEKLCSFQFRRIISLTVDSQDSWFEIPRWVGF